MQDEAGNVARSLAIKLLPFSTGRESICGQRIVFAEIVAAALNGRECPSNKRLCEALGNCALGLPPRRIEALERKGLIKVTRYQRAREIYIPALGKSTRPHSGSKTAHWRDSAHRKTPVPA